MPEPNEPRLPIAVPDVIIARWQRKRADTVLLVGDDGRPMFDALLSAWRAHADKPVRLHVVAVCPEPWPLAIPGMQRVEFDEGQVSLTIYTARVAQQAAHVNDAAHDLSRATADAALALEQALPRLELQADSIIVGPLDGKCLTTRAAKGLARLAGPGALLVLAAVVADVPAARAKLTDAGFVFESATSAHAGYVPRGRHARETMTQRGAAQTLPGAIPDLLARPRHRNTASTVPPALPPDAPHAWGHAIVIGAGLAGCAVAAALASRGWSIDLVDAGNMLASQASAQPVLAQSLHLSPDDNVLARLTRNALLLSAGTAWTRNGGIIETGRLMLSTGADDFDAQRDMLSRLRLPSHFVRAVSPAEASFLAGVPVPRGGLWLPMAGCITAHAACHAWLAPYEGEIRLRLGTTVTALERSHAWQAHCSTPGNRPVTLGAPVVILACAADSIRLAGARDIPISQVGGQTTLLSAAAVPGLRCCVSGDAYACPLPDGRVLAGATFDDSPLSAPTTAADDANLSALSRLLGRSTESLVPFVTQSTRGFRAVARDRLPVIGAMPDETQVALNAQAHMRNDRLPLARQPGLYGAFAFGSRGLLWAPLAAELIAARLCGEPLSMEPDLAAAVDPARFARQALRRAQR